MTDDEAIALAIAEAKAAALRGEVPVGAVLTKDGEMVAKSGNRIVEWHDPTAHAEMLVIREAARRLNNERLVGTVLYVSLEPCAMCAGAIAMARIDRVVFATCDPKGGAVMHGAKFFEQPTCHHHPIVEQKGNAEIASALLRDFFRARRT
jgi:tRNA(adenine34) deaminase